MNLGVILHELMSVREKRDYGQKRFRAACTGQCKPVGEHVKEEERGESGHKQLEVNDTKTETKGKEASRISFPRSMLSSATSPQSLCP